MKGLNRFFLALIAVVATSVLAVQGQVPGVNNALQSVFTLAYDQSTMKPTYSVFSQNFAAAATAPGDICTLNGSATKTIKVRRAYFGGVATTAVTEPVYLLTRSTANAGGTATYPTPASYDSNNSAATAFADFYTANPTTSGTLTGEVAAILFSFGNLTTGGAQTMAQIWQVGQLGSPVVLRGAAQTFAISLAGIAESGSQLVCGFEWTEE